MSSSTPALSEIQLRDVAQFVIFLTLFYSVLFSADKATQRQLEYLQSNDVTNSH